MIQYTSLSHYFCLNDLHNPCVIHICTGIVVRFRQNRYTVSEAARSVTVILDLIGGASADEFSISVIPSEQSPVSAQGNSVMCVLLCVD